MTQPMTPREKVDCICVTSGNGSEGCGVCNETGTRASGSGDSISLQKVQTNSGDPDLQKMQIGGGDQLSKNLGQLKSGDHAELARLAEAATPGPWSYRDMRPNTYGPAFVDSAEVQSLAICGEAVGLSEAHGFCLQVDSEVRMANAAFIAAANPATVLALIAENAALRTLWADADALASEHFVALREKQDDAQMLYHRATEAERKLAEARGLLSLAATRFDEIYEAAEVDDVAYRNEVTIHSINANADWARSEIRTFLSSTEAERG